MNTKEKAKELIEKFRPFVYCYSFKEIAYDENEVIKNAKQCAIIAVEEILKAIDWHEFETPNKEFEYWQQVKNELNE